MLLTIEIPTYRTIVTFRVCSSEKNLLKWNNKLSCHKDLTIDFNGRTFPPYIDINGFNSIDVIVLKDKLTHGLVSHEVTHVVSYLLRDSLGIHLTSNSEEAYAYLIEYLVQCIYIGLRDREVTIKCADELTIKE